MAQVRKIAIESKAEKQTNSWHKSMKIVILVANCLGLLPVNGVTSDSVHNLSFRWMSLKVFYSFVWLSIAVMNVITNSISVFQRGLSLTELSMVE